jgi:hypothetical protein
MISLSQEPLLLLQPSGEENLRLSFGGGGGGQIAEYKKISFRVVLQKLK